MCPSGRQVRAPHHTPAHPAGGLTLQTVTLPSSGPPLPTCLPSELHRLGRGLSFPGTPSTCTHTHTHTHLKAPPPHPPTHQCHQQLSPPARCAWSSVSTWRRHRLSPCSVPGAAFWNSQKLAFVPFPPFGDRNLLDFCPPGAGAVILLSPLPAGPWQAAGTLMDRPSRKPVGGLWAAAGALAWEGAEAVGLEEQAGRAGLYL